MHLRNDCSRPTGSTFTAHQGTAALTLRITGVDHCFKFRLLVISQCCFCLNMPIHNAASGCSLAPVCNNLHKAQSPLSFYEPPVTVSVCLYYHLPYVPSSYPFLIFAREIYHFFVLLCFLITNSSAIIKIL